MEECFLRRRLWCVLLRIRWYFRNLRLNFKLLFMRLTLLLFSVLPLALMAQTSRVTVASGDFYNPLIWNPVGWPASGDSLQINHAVVLNLDIYYTAGQIKINPTGSLIQDAAPRTIWIDGGSLINYGTHTTHLIYVSNGGLLHNYANMTGIDSMMVQAYFTNYGNAGINDFWVMPGGLVSNVGTMYNTDSMFVQGTFTNTGAAAVYDLAFDEMAILNNTGTLDVTHNMHNQGKLYNSYTIDVANDFSNCNTQNLRAVFDNDGTVCFGNDFLNCDTDTITGSGDYYVANLSSNLGVFSGSHTFHTPTGALTFNGGIVQPSVTVTTGTCGLSLLELNENFEMYPNPTSGLLHLSLTNAEVSILDISGNRVKTVRSSDTGTINVQELAPGMYFIAVEGYSVQRFVKD